MRHNYINRIACAILLWFFACVIAQAGQKLSQIEADIHYLDGSIKHVENLSIPYGNVFSKSHYVTYSIIDEKNKVKKIDLESEPMDYIVCWHASNPKEKYIFEKIRIASKGHKYWCVLTMEGKKGKVFRKADKYEINEEGELTLTFKEGTGTYTLYSLFLFEGDEYASMCPGGPNGWIMYGRAVFTGDKQMLQNLRANKYNVEDLQEILDTYQRPEPLKCKKDRND